MHKKKVVLHGSFFKGWLQLQMQNDEVVQSC